jgi:ribA/ribD-fused uncharacterized protein
MSKHASLEFADLRHIYDQSVPGHFATDDYVFFWAGPFSNWHPAKFTMGYNEGGRHEFNCSEQAMMFCKACLFDDHETADKILKSKMPGEQKALGRAVRNYKEEAWVAEREWIVDEILYQKFTQDAELKKILLDTGDRTIVEASPYDKVWGIAMGVDKYPAILDPNNWKGQNLLGKCLMRVRDKIRKEDERTN